MNLNGDRVNVNEYKMATNSIQIRQVALGSRPISYPAWPSAVDPVVKDPVSAKGISFRTYVSQTSKTFMMRTDPCL
jgi:hypothetical protein